MYELPPLKKTIAIAIPTQQSLINMRFDPTQNSPPSLWKLRLNKRVADSHIKRVADSPIKHEIAAKLRCKN